MRKSRWEFGLIFAVVESSLVECVSRRSLDPAMNWQIVSALLLTQFANQLADHATAVSNEAERLARVYSSLDNRAAKRHIRAKQEYNKKLAAQVTTAAQRVAKLETLLAQLESNGAIGFRVWVEWPDTEQTLLSAVAVQAEDNE